MSDRNDKSGQKKSALNVRPGVVGGHDGLPGSADNAAEKSGPRRRAMTTDEYVQGVLSGDRTLLARAITLIESNAQNHQAQAQEVLTALLPKRRPSIRVGITGVPGAGKSTFIENLGGQLTAAGHKVVGAMPACFGTQIFQFSDFVTAEFPAGQVVAPQGYLLAISFRQAW